MRRTSEDGSSFGSAFSAGAAGAVAVSEASGRPGSLTGTPGPALARLGAATIPGRAMGMRACTMPPVLLSSLVVAGAALTTEHSPCCRSASATVCREATSGHHAWLPARAAAPGVPSASPGVPSIALTWIRDCCVSVCWATGGGLGATGRGLGGLGGLGDGSSSSGGGRDGGWISC